MRRITIMHIIVSLIAVAILSVQFCQAAQMGQYDFSGDLTAHFAPSPPPMGEGATFVQSSGAMLFHNASTNARLEIVMHKNYQPGTDHDWAVSVDASIPLAYDTSPPPENGDAWIELVLAVQYLDAQDNQNTFLDALGVYYDKSGGGPLGRQLSPAELLNGEKVPHPDDESFLTNETAVLTIAYSASSMTLSATSAGTKLLTISLQDWHSRQPDDLTSRSTGIRTTNPFCRQVQCVWTTLPIGQSRIPSSARANLWRAAFDFKP